MFFLTREEIRNLSQIVISPKIKHAPNVFAFTEQGVAMLSSVLNSKRAIEVNILIMRAFVRLREAMASSKELTRRLYELERRIANHDESIRTLFQAIRELMTPSEPPRKRIGFQLREKHFPYKARLKRTKRGRPNH